MRPRSVLMTLYLMACGSTSTTTTTTTTTPASPTAAAPSPEAPGPRTGDPDPSPQAPASPPPSMTAGDTVVAPRAPAGPAAASVPGGSLVLSNTWTDCVKGFVEAQKGSARDPLLDALSVYFTTCDKVERLVVFDAPRPEPSGHDYVFESYVSFGGQLSKARSKAWLSAVYHGDTAISAERIKVAADEFRWTSPRLTFAREDGAKVRESAELPYTRTLQPVIRRMIEARDVTVRFEGRGGHADLVVTDDMKHDLKLMMDALTVLNLP